ncbi:ketosteroid isomerase-like protein [Spinactinospora alkalitolerans]|uniref:Ketosteroid isomerase-like protein n=1 Tax=Spinactinospora alkalitolerans TaxID=687207 RepID=A0A852U420_9ACTN|nr:nuclear transport factor 2 family protein [Spinactinospora alkalitolerans]NYE50939.1 ketosteroid isomerase-like protein [Spinactinospora alkalitolerans]
MSIMEERKQPFDVAELRHAIEDRDAEAMLRLFADDAEMRIVNRNSPPRAPQTLRGRDQISEALRDVYGREMRHELRNVVVQDDHAAYEELCTYPDGTKVLGIMMVDLANGRIMRQTGVEAWDEEEAAMGGAEQADFTSPDETRTFDRGRIEVVNVAGRAIGRLVLEPGWRWSECVKPLVGTELCMTAHFAYHASGTLAVRMADGTEFEVTPDQVAQIPPGHDAWVVGDEPVVAVDWQGALHYSQR